MSGQTIINCPACGNGVSPAAAACPKCGQPMNKPSLWHKFNRSPVLIVVVLVVLLLLIFGPKAISEFIVLHVFGLQERRWR